MTDPISVEQALQLAEKGELPWLELKRGWWDPEGVGKYVSALANAAAIHHEPFGYLVWGVADSGEAVGTDVDPTTAKVKGQPFEFWLRQRLSLNPPIGYRQGGFDGSYGRVESRRARVCRFGVGVMAGGAVR